MVSGALLTTKALCHSYKSDEVENHVLKNVNFTMIEKEFVAILGPSGCGKTTFMNLIGGLEKPTSGQIEVCGSNITSLNNSDLCRYRRDKIAFIFQFYNLFPNLTAFENVMAGIEILGLPQSECNDRANQYLTAVGLEKKREHLPSHLSGGEQQRVAIARALAKRAPIILADEPTGNLDTKTGERIMELFQQINNDHSASILMITHDTTVATKASRIVKLLNGSIVHDQIVESSKARMVNAI
jgi:putative ABC transport system ATP-binding protein